MRGRVAVLLLVGLAVMRVLLVMANDATDPDRLLADDSGGYLGPARALVEDGRYTEQPGSITPALLRTPGYPVFLATFLAVDRNLALAVAVQAAVSVLAVLLTYLTARRLDVRPGWATAGAAVVALDPFQTATSGLVMTESLATVLMAALAYTAVRLARSDFALPWAAALGGLLVVATYVRPTTLYLPFVLVVALVVLAGRNPDLRHRSLLAGGVVLAITLPLTGLWYLRNHHEFDSWTFTSSEAITLYWYRAGGLVAEQEGIDWDPDARLLLTLRLNPGMPEVVANEIRHGAVPPDEQGNEGQYYERARSEALEILLDDPAGTARQAVRGLYSQAVSSGWTTAAGVYGIDLPGPVDRLGVAVNLLVEVVAAIGVVVAVAGRALRRAHLLVLVLLGYTLFINAGYQATAGHRFRAVLLPIIALYAAIGAEHLYDRWRRRRPAPDPAGATG